MKLEIACFNLESAFLAHQYLADRVELCQNISVGGLTPTYDDAKSARLKLSIDLYVMIRPTPGNYIYSNKEFEQMKKDIIHFKKIEINGFVFGILNEEGNVNKKQNKELIELAHPLPCTFHRAFDVVDNPLNALEDVIECGFKTILTSGQKPTAIEGAELLAELIKHADNRIEIMACGSIRSSNISLLKEKVKTTFYHSSAIVDNTDVANSQEIQLLRKLLLLK